MSDRNFIHIVIDRLFGTWERVLAFLGIVLGVLSPIVSFYILKYPKAIPGFIVIRDVVFLIVLVIIIMILATVNVRKEIVHKNKLDELNNNIVICTGKQLELQRMFAMQLKHANDIAQRTTQELFHHYRGIFLGKADIDASPDEFKVFEKICLSVTNHVRESLVTHFRTIDIDQENDLSVSIKLILPLKSIKSLYPNQFNKTPKDVRQKDLRVITAFRDNKTWDANKTSGERETTNAIYSIEENTAFDDIVNKRRDRFVENDLDKLGVHYHNRNPNWKRQYNSTLVVPIVLQESVNVPKEECRFLGFLAVDSLNTSGKHLYDDDCYNILNHAAITLSNYFMVIILYHDR